MRPLVEDDMHKSFFRSRTIWFNVAAALLPILADNLLLARPYLTDGGYLIYMCLVSAGNVYLRTITTTGVRLK